jgi:NitT/TauT family transport system substrate-binding protein
MLTRRSLLTGSMTMAGCAFAGVGSAVAQTIAKTNLRFNWSWVGNYAPIVMGVQRGYFKDLGLDLQLDQGKGSGATVRQAGLKNDKFVWADQSAVFVAAAQGVPIKTIMVMAQSNLAVIWIEGRAIVKTGKDLIGKKISATPGDGNTQMWPAVLAANNLKPSDVEMVFMDGTVATSALREGRVDLMLGGASDQAASLRSIGVPARATMFAELGVPTLGSGVITHPDTIKESPDLCRKLIAGIQKSWEEGLKDPEAAIRALIKQADIPLSEKVLRDGLQVFTSLLTKKQPMGYIEPAEMQKTLDLLKLYGGVKTELPATAFYTNEFMSRAS